MKLFLVLLLVGCVSASFKEDFEKASSEAVKAFKRGLEQAPPLHLALGVDRTEELQRFERGVKEDLEKYIKEAFEKTLDKIVQAIKAGKNVNPDAVLSLLELEKKMKDFDIMDHELEGIKEQIDDHVKKILEKMGILDARSERSVKEDLEKYIKDAFEKTLKKVLQAIIDGKDVHPEAVKSLLELKEKMKDLDIMEHEKEGIREQIDEHLQKILEKMGILDASYSVADPLHSMFEDLSFRNFFIRMKEMILEKMNVSNVKQGLSKALGQVSQSLCQWLTNKGQEKVMNFFDRILESDEEESEVDKRAVSEDLQDRLQDYISDVNESIMHLQSKLMRFQNWVQTSVIQSLALAQDHIEEVRTVAKGAVEQSMNTTSAIKKIYEKEV